MKKKLFGTLIAATLACASTAILLTACGKDEEPTNTPPAETTYTVAYTLGESATGGPAGASVTAGTVIDFTASTMAEPTKAGYSFLGWQVSGSDAIYNKQGGTLYQTSYTVNANVTFTAVWEEGTGDVTAPVKKALGSSYYVQLANETAEEYWVLMTLDAGTYKLTVTPTDSSFTNHADTCIYYGDDYADEYSYAAWYNAIGGRGKLVYGESIEFTLAEQTSIAIKYSMAEYEEPESYVAKVETAVAGELKHTVTYLISENVDGNKVSGMPVNLVVENITHGDMHMVPEAPTYADSDYVFIGWLLNNIREAAVTGEIPVNDDITLVAAFGKKHTLTYTWGSGVTGVTGDLPSAVTFGEFQAIDFDDVPSPLPTRENYIFESWQYSYVTESGVEPNILDKKDLMPDFDVTATAQWAAARTVTYVMNGATSEAIPAEVIKVGAYALEPFTTPERTGYTFAGWTYTYNDGAEKTITGEDDGLGGKKYLMPAYDVTATANWKKNYTVSISIDGSGTSTDLDYLEGDKLNDNDGFYTVMQESQFSIVWKKQGESTAVAEDADVAELCGAGASVTLMGYPHLTIGASDHSTAYPGDKYEGSTLPVWTITPGYQISFSGDMTSAAAQNYQAPYLYLYSETRNGCFGFDTRINDASGYLAREGWTVMQPTLPNYENGHANFRNVIVNCTFTLTVNYASRSELLVTFKAVGKNSDLVVETQIQQYKIVPTSGQLAETYNITIGIEGACVDFTSYEKHAHHYDSTTDLCDHSGCGYLNPNHGDTANGGVAHNYEKATTDRCSICNELNPNHGDTDNGGGAHQYNNKVCSICGAPEPHVHSFTNHICTECKEVDYSLATNVVNLTLDMSKGYWNANDKKDGVPGFSTIEPVVLSTGAGNCYGYISYNYPANTGGTAIGVIIGENNYRTRVDVDHKDCWGTWNGDNAVNWNPNTISENAYLGRDVGIYKLFVYRESSNLVIILSYYANENATCTKRTVVSYNNVSTSDAVSVYLLGDGSVVRTNVVGYSSLAHNFGANHICQDTGCKQIDYAALNAMVASEATAVTNDSHGEWNGFYGSVKVSGGEGNGCVKYTFDIESLCEAGLAVKAGDKTYKWRIFAGFPDIWYTPDSGAGDSIYQAGSQEKTNAWTIGTNPGEGNDIGSVVVYAWRVDTTLYLSATFANASGIVTYRGLIQYYNVATTEMTIGLTSHPVGVGNIQGYAYQAPAQA